MSTAPINEREAVLYYQDTDAPPNSNEYTTVILVHGAGFHGASFRRMTPFAHKHNLRFIIPNLRDYPGSTPYTEEELADLRGPDKDRQERALRSRAFELAAFLKWVIETENIPPRREVPGLHSTVGGISLLSWSAASCQTMGLFAFADQLPEDTRKLLDTYLRSYVIYEASLGSTGRKCPPELHAVRSIREPGMSPEEFAEVFSLSVGAYYPPFTFPDVIDPVPTFAPRPAIVDNPGFPPSTTRMTAEELRGMMHIEPLDNGRSQNLYTCVDPDIYSSVVERALLDKRFAFGTTLEEVWPALRVHVLWCDMSVGNCVWASAVLKFMHAAAAQEWRRPMEVHKLAGANHFVHWDEPERFVKVLTEIA